MAELSRFYGIVIRMYGNDHAPPHFHARQLRRALDRCNHVPERDSDI